MILQTKDNDMCPHCNCPNDMHDIHCPKDMADAEKKAIKDHINKLKSRLSELEEVEGKDE